MLRQLDGQHVTASVLVALVEPGQHPGADQAARQPQRPAAQPQLGAAVLVVVGEQSPHHREAVLLAGHDVDQHRVVDLHPRDQLLGHAGHELVEGLLAPDHGALGRLPEVGLALLLGPLLLAHRGVLGGGLGLGLLVVDDVLGGLDDDVPGGVEAGPPCPSGDLQELPHPQHPLTGAVELGQPGEQHRADRHVDADPEGVGAADHGEQPGLGQLLDQAAVARQHAGVVHPDAAAQQLGERLAEAGTEAEVGQPLSQAVLVGGLDRRAGEQRARVLDGSGLGEVHDVHR